jgi:hypothetical protein
MQIKDLKKILFLTLATTFVSCSMVQSIGVKSAAGILQSGVKEVNTEANYRVFKDSTVANLKVLESLWYTQQDNEDLLTLLIKGYGGLAFGISETSFLDDKLKGEDQSVHKDQGIYHYSKAFRYGLKYFKENGINPNELLSKEAPLKMNDLLNSNMGDDDMMAIFYFAQSWGGMINLQRHDVRLMSSLGTVKAMMDWVCKRDPNFEFGSCSLFYGVYEAGRPAMLGGSLEKGKAIFEQMIKKYPQNLLAKVAFLQYYIIPTIDEVLYAKAIEELNKEIIAFEGVKNYSKVTSKTQIYLDHPQFNLFNSIAIERIKIIKKNKDEIF